ncbi:MAG: DNA recombination protein RmuC [Spirochaetes bacterium]|nr:DNA recombination protein RmuC [Spirochaetota bacterium]
MSLLPFLIAALALPIGIVLGYFAGTSRSGGALALSREQFEKTRADLAAERARSDQLAREHSAMGSDLKNLRERLAEERRQLDEIQKRFEAQFKSLAESILEDKSRKFDERNRLEIEKSQAWLTGLVTPLKERLQDFKQKLEALHESEAKNLHTLSGQIHSLSDLNKKMSEEAQRLTSALKGDQKIQGNYGEMMLERVLEFSGLQKDVDYELQRVFTQEGQRLIPDCLLHLPGEKVIIVDAKMSLTAYAELSGEADAARAEALLAAHVASVRAHVDGLSKKGYDRLPGLESLEMVLLFIPNEPAFLAALRADRDLHARAFEKKILIVSPTTLLAVLKVVFDAWRHERQGRNALEIARIAGDLHDKFVQVVDDLKGVDEKIEAAQRALQGAFGRLSTGKGNLIRQVTRIKELGAKAGKSLPPELLQEAEEEDEG